MFMLYYVLFCHIIRSSSSTSPTESERVSTYATPKIFSSGFPNVTASTLPTIKTLPTTEGQLPTEAVTFNKQTEESNKTFLSGKSKVTTAAMLSSSTATRKRSTPGFRFTTPWILLPLPTMPRVTPHSDKKLSDILEQNPDFIESFLTGFHSLCPDNTKICYTDVIPATPSNSGGECCVHCSCSITCKAEKNCCPSKTTKVAQYVNTKYFRFLFCQSTYKLLIYDTAMQLRNKGYKEESGYYFVSTCPASALEEEKTLCENMARTDKFSVFDTVPVTDLRDNTHFANGFCAACHNIPKESIKPWNVGISCLRDKILLEEENKDNFVRRNPDCYVSYMPPDGVSDSTLFSCTPNVIDRCNTFGEWHTYDEEIESLCLDVRLEKFYVASIDFVEYRFKNVFCAVCNGFKAEEVDDCKPVIIGPLNPPALHSLFTFSGSNVANMGFNRRSCTVGTVFIPVFGMCRKVHCTLPYLADILRNKCILRAVASPSQSVYIPVMINLNQSIQFSNMDELKSNIIEILESVYPNSCRCGVSIAYELDTAYDPDMSEQTIQETQIKTLYISLHLIESSTEFDYATFVATANSVHIVNMLDSKVMFTLNHGHFDPLFLTEDGSQEEHVIIKPNPYNNAALVFYPSISDNCACANKNEIGTKYPLQFMECPSVLVALEHTDITRVASGLRIGHNRHTIPLNNVRSLNYTHVHICVDSINGEHLLSHGNPFLKENEFLCIYTYVSLLIVILMS